VVYDLRVYGIGITFTKREIIDCIEQISLPHAVVAYEAVYFGGKLQFCLHQILIVDDG